MSRVRDTLGISGEDLAIHVGATVVLAVIVVGSAAKGNYDGETIATLMAAASAAVLGIRMFVGRRNRLSQAPSTDPGSLRDMDDRLNDLERERARLHELEERVDFTERLLTQARQDKDRIEGPR